jgi:hypothetical protein
VINQDMSGDDTVTTAIAAWLLSSKSSDWLLQGRSASPPDIQLSSPSLAPPTGVKIT